MKLISFKALIILVFWSFLPVVMLGQVYTDTLSQQESEQLQKRIEKELKKAERKYVFQFLPIVYYTPETDWAFGAGGNFLFKFDLSDSLLPVSKVTPSFVYTLNNQMLARVDFDLYTNKKWRVFGDIGYYVYPYFFSGIGNKHQGNYKEYYDADYPRLNINIYRHVFSDSISIGLRYDYQNSNIIPFSGGLLESGKYPGYEGSVQSSLGTGFMYDSRNFPLASTKGGYADISIMWSDNWTGATYSDQFVLIDLRKYFSVSKKEDVIAVQLYSEIHSGDVPFNLMAMLGGSERMRGYREGLFRDRQMVVYQAEYRSRMFFKHFGFALFANLGGIGNDFQDVNNNYRYTVGGGLRFSPMAEERYFIRLDYGAGQNTQGFYIAVGEAF
ncbi:MAG: BamA/TamA family outer membrane protein [Salibacteraceae bacterium]